jgi:hypothetical protein
MSTDENQIEELQKIYEAGMTEMGIPLVDPRIEKISQRLKAAADASVIYIKASLDSLSDEDAQTVAPLFDELKSGMSVKAGDVYSWDGTLIEVIQAHTTQDDWSPTKTPALYRVFRTPDMVKWIPNISVKVGERLEYNGATYEVVQAHTTMIGWEPDKVPSLWKKV